MVNKRDLGFVSFVCLVSLIFWFTGKYGLGWIMYMDEYGHGRGVLDIGVLYLFLFLFLFTHQTFILFLIVQNITLHFPRVLQIMQPPKSAL